MNDFNPESTEPEQTPGQVFDKAKHAVADRCQTACDNAKEMVAKNPLPTVLGALAFGVAIGFLISRREPAHEAQHFYDRLVRDAQKRLHEGSGRISSLLHDGVEAASRGAGRASHFIHDLPTDRVMDTVTNSLNRFSNRLKFW